MVQIIKQTKAITELVNDFHDQGYSVGLVPTMGGLHEGHLSLVRTALASHDKVIVSIYVNPTQFAEGEDLERYPRQLDEDCAALSAVGGDITIFAPHSLYNDNHTTMITPQGPALMLEGVHRPHFFTGVATVVFRLFQIVPANAAYFGEKDFQQLAVIKQMVRDFDLPIKITPVLTSRADDGLALSSRNSYLDKAERQIATQLYAEMKKAAQNVKNGMAPAQSCQAAVSALQAHGFDNCDYFMWCDPQTLKEVTDVTSQSRLMAAIWLGNTRLIDNDCYDNLCSAQN